MRKIKALKSLVAAAAALAITFSAVGSYNGGSAENERESYLTQLSEIEDQQKSVDSQIASADSDIQKEKDNFAAINKDYADVRKRISDAEEEAARLEKQIAETDEKMTDTSDKIDLKTQQIQSETADFMKRIRAMYVAGGTATYVNVLAEASDFYDVLTFEHTLL